MSLCLSFSLFPYTTLFRSSPSYVSFSIGEPVGADYPDVPDRSSSDPVPIAKTCRWGPDQKRNDPVHPGNPHPRSEEHTSELQSRGHLVCRLLLEKKKKSKD